MKLYRFHIPSDKFTDLSKEEKLFVLCFSQLHNDLRHVLQLVQTANNGITSLNGIEREIATHQFLFSVRLWCGILREAKHMYDSGWNQKWALGLRDSLNEETLQAGREFSAYFGDRNRICDIRDRFAFHYDDEVIEEELETEGLRKFDYQFITSDRSGNIFYNSAEAYRTLAMLRAVDVDLTGLRKLYDEISPVHDNFMTFSQAVLVAIVKKTGPQSTNFTSTSVVDQQKVEPIIFIDEDAIVKKFARGS